MQRNLWRSGVIWVALVASVAGYAQAQQTATATETRNFSVISVDGNKVVLRDQAGTREYTVPPDFRFTVDGRQVTVAELKPGMTGTATITRTTTVTPVTVTEVKEAEVVQATGNSVLVRGAQGYRMFTPGEVQKRNITIIRNGKPVDFSELRAGDRLTATIITEGAPRVMTEQQVQATLKSAPAPGKPAATAPAAPPPAASAPAARPAAAPPPTGAPPAATTAPDPAKRLPKTASPLPLLGVTGVISFGVALTLTTLRRRRARH